MRKEESMPRPRHDSEILPAKERLENAFWELLADRDYRKITVTDVVREAGVNRNSFYYHFSGLPELADSAILHEVEAVPFTRSDLGDNPKEQWREHIGVMLSNPDQRRRLDRMSLLAGPHSTLELTESLRDFGRLQIISMLQRDPEQLDLKTDLVIDFTVGGLLQVLRRWPELSDTIEIKDLMKEDVAVLAMGVYLAMSREDMLDYWNRIFTHGDQALDGGKRISDVSHSAQ
jgi:AcrR family transcriptional regulator